ncbi:MAG: hypothetical protein PHG40_02880 [Candidatus Omnitrophica bacterium]|nr:hypothetical protein [Candidatus Omnitrophota bacterium]
MRRALSLVLVLLLSFTYAYCQTPQTEPSAQEVKSVLKNYLTSSGVMECDGYITLEHLSNIRLGGYDQKLGGWPVYAKHKQTCHSGKSKMTYDNTGDYKEAIAAVVRRNPSGDLECFTPQIFKEAAQDLNKALERAGAELEEAIKEGQRQNAIQKKWAQETGLIKEGLAGQIVKFRSGETLGNFDISGLNIWVEDGTVFEGVDSFDKLEPDMPIAVTYYIFGNKAIAKHVQVLRSSK